MVRVAVCGIGVHGPQQDPTGNNEDCPRRGDPDEYAHRRVGQRADTDADRGADDDGPCESDDGGPRNCSAHER